MHSPRSFGSGRSSAGAKTDADLRPWSGSGSQHARSKGSWELPLRDRLTPLCSRWRHERGRAVAGQSGRPTALRPGVRGVQGLATWQLQVERLRRALGGRFSILARSSRGLHHAFAIGSRPRCQLRGSRGASLDVEVLRRPKWRWRPAHSDAASNFHQVSSCMSKDLGETHRTCAGPEDGCSGSCRARATVTPSAGHRVSLSLSAAWWAGGDRSIDADASAVGRCTT